MRIYDFNLFNIFESNSKLKFIKQPKKEYAKTDTYKVFDDEVEVGLVKWSSRMRGYAFLPLPSCESEIKEFIKDLMSKRRKERK